MKEKDIIEIIEKFDTDREFLLSREFPDGGTDPLSGQLHRAAYNQLCEDGTMVKQYGIWAHTVRNNIQQADVDIKNNNHKEARRLLHRAANSLLAFAELQEYFEKI
jgi:hypothetical protein